jgi:hypothetical protein
MQPEAAALSPRPDAPRRVLSLAVAFAAALGSAAPAAAATPLARATAAQDADPAARWLADRAPAAIRAAVRAPVPSARPRRPGARVEVEVESPAAALSAPVPDRRPTRTERAAARREEAEASAAAAAAAAQRRESAGATAPGAARDAGAARPAQTAVAAAARGATVRGKLPPSQTALLGVIAGPDGRVALLRLPGGEVRRVRRGDRVEGMTVAAVSDSSVQLNTGSGVQVLTIPTR